VSRLTCSVDSWVGPAQIIEDIDEGSTIEKVMASITTTKLYTTLFNPGKTEIIYAIKIVPIQHETHTYDISLTPAFYWRDNHTITETLTPCYYTPAEVIVDIEDLF